jgi:hypothetical protein
MHPKRGAVLIDFSLARGVETGAVFSHMGVAGTEALGTRENFSELI